MWDYHHYIFLQKKARLVFILYLCYTFVPLKLQINVCVCLTCSGTGDKTTLAGKFLLNSDIRGKPKPPKNINENSDETNITKNYKLES